MPLDEGPDELAAQLSQRFWERLRLFAARRLGDPVAAEDVAQEALGRTLEALREGRVHNLDALPSFLYETARHVCQHQARSRGRQAAALSRLAPTEEPAQADAVTQLIGEERRRAVRDACDRLPAGDRELLRLFFGEGLDTAEVAQRLRVTREVVRVRKHRALSRLRETLEPPGNLCASSGTKE